MSDSALRLTRTEGVSGWIGFIVPKNLSELAEHFAERVKWYRRFPEKVDNYYRDVSVGGKGSCVTYTRREKEPRMVGARLGLAKAALHNVCWWLDEHRISGRPLPETLSDDEDEAGRQLSRMLIWLEKAVKEQEQTPRLTVNLDKRQITLNGKTYDVGSESALRWVKVMADHPGVWISALQLKKHDPELDGSRPHRFKKHLPDAILDLIDSETGKGSRLRLA